MRYSGLVKFAFILLPVFSCTKEADAPLTGAGTEAETTADCPVRVEAVIEGGESRVTGKETKDKNYALSWEAGDVLSACWKDASSNWHKVYFKATELDASTGAALFTYKSGDIPTAEGTIVSAVSLGNTTQLDFTGAGNCKVDFGDQSENAAPVLLFSKATLKGGGLVFTFTVKSAFIRFAGLKGLPDLDFQGVKDYFPEVRISGSSLGTTGTLSVKSDGTPSLTVSSTKNQSIVLSKGKGVSGTNSTRKFEFQGGKEADLLVSVLPFTSSSTAKTDLTVTASAVYGNYSKTLPATSAAIAAKDYIHIDDTLKLLPPALKSEYDENRPVGFGGCYKETDKDGKIIGTEVLNGYVLDGGRRGKKTVVLTATGDDGERIKNAILDNDIIILDGSKGDFVFKEMVTVEDRRPKNKMVENKTIVGVNGAFLRTYFHLSSDDIAKLKKAGLIGLSQTSGTGGPLYDPADNSGFYTRWKDKHKLPDGSEYNPVIDNELELKSRRAMVDIESDPLENYRNSTGIFSFNNVSNLIIRNLKIRGGGAVDINGFDCLKFSISDIDKENKNLHRASNHVWIDHCDLSDGTDGNFDNNGHCDFFSVTWTHQFYGSDNFNHTYSCIMGGGVYDGFTGKQHYTFQFCKWGVNIESRTPMVRYGTVHLLNNYYAYYGGPFAIEALIKSSLFLDHCYFIPLSDPSTQYWISDRSLQAEGEGSSIKFDSNYNLGTLDTKKARGTVSIPYTYSKPATASSVKDIVENAVGPTLTNPLDYN